MQAAMGQPVSVVCNDDLDCHVTCPDSACTVTNCNPADGCVVACGLTGQVAKQDGTTASCN